jgi:hypothetical protein
MMEEEKCDCTHEQAGQRRLDSLRPTGASTDVHALCAYEPCPLWQSETIPSRGLGVGMEPELSQMGSYPGPEGPTKWHLALSGHLGPVPIGRGCSSSWSIT